jgi:hypothetical protein
MGWINLNDGDRIYLSQDGRLSNQFLANSLELGYVASEGEGLVLYIAGNRYAIRNSRFPIHINPVQPGMQAVHQAFHHDMTAQQGGGLNQLTDLAHHAQTFVLSEEAPTRPEEEPKEGAEPEKKKKAKEKKNSRFALLDE